PWLLSSVGIAAAVGAILVVVVGDRYLRIVGTLDPTRLAVCLLAALAGLSFLFAGRFGVVTYVAAAVIGLVPARFGARRANLMGVLMGPLILGG
ncbi:MAG: tripartite tricarboxylate transporter permease, partial [Natronomonas sp.]